MSLISYFITDHCQLTANRERSRRRAFISGQVTFYTSANTQLNTQVTICKNELCKSPKVVYGGLIYLLWIRMTGEAGFECLLSNPCSTNLGLCLCCSSTTILLITIHNISQGTENFHPSIYFDFLKAVWQASALSI